ncbi:hypothetical protein [Glycomyces tenuis]|nr:hypothetical protein [Glycomyces tenuis]
MAEYLSMARSDGLPEAKARELAEGMSRQDLRFVMEMQRLEEPESDHEGMRRLLRARSDPRMLAAALPRGRMRGELGAGLVLLLLFCVGCLVTTLVMPFTLAGPVVGLVADVGAVAVYLAVRPVVKRLGVFSMGSFTVDAAGVVRAVSGVGQARRRARRDGEEPGLANLFGVAAVFLLLVLGVPVTVAVAADLPEVMLAWMVMAMLVLNETTLLIVRTRRDVLRRPAEVLDSEFGLALATDYLRRGGDAGRLAEGVGLRELAPPGEGAFISVMRDAFLRRSIARLVQED